MLEAGALELVEVLLLQLEVNVEAVDDQLMIFSDVPLILDIGNSTTALCPKEHHVSVLVIPNFFRLYLLLKLVLLFLE